MAVMSFVLTACTASHKHLVPTDCLLPKRIKLLIQAHIIAGRATLMLSPLVLFHVPVAPVLTALTLVLSIRASPTHHVTIRVRTFVGRLGTMRHLIAYFPARAAMIVNAPTKRFASRIQRAIKLTHSCVELVSKMPLPVSGLVHQEAAVSVLLGSLALPTRHAEHLQDLDKDPRAQDLGKNLPVQDLVENLLVQDLDKSLPVQDLGKNLPIQDLGKSLPIQVLGKSLPIQDLDKSLLVQAPGKSLPVQDLG